MGLIEKLKKTFLGNEDTDLQTFTNTDENIQKSIKRKIGVWVIILVIVIPFVYIITKTAYRYIDYHYIKKVEIEKMPEEEKLNMVINDDEIWKTKTEEEQKNIKKDLNNVKVVVSELSQALKVSTTEIKEQIELQNKNTIKQQEELKNIINQSVDNTNKKIEDVKKEYDTQIEDVKNNIEKKSNTKIDPNKLVSIMQPQNTTNQPNEIKKDIVEEPKEVEQVEYLEVVEDSFSVSTIDNFKEEKKQKPKKFIMDAGFGKATILAAGEFNTIDKGEDDRIPVFLSIDTSIITANGEEIDLKNCLVRGTGVGDFSTSKANITVTQLDCKLKDEDGNNYRISEKVHGVIYDETGGYSLKGRLLTKEGEIFEKALPIGLLEAGMNILMSKANETTNDSGVISFNQGTNQLTGVGDTIINKMGEYWVKYLNALNPKVDVRAGRQVVVAFFGGEELNIKKYIPASLENFENGLLDEINIEDKTTGAIENNKNIKGAKNVK
jgi:conjugal transfer pilus assembly protein TraB